ncbi:uncharacterized protein V6R79_003699 [Siganus canaliculatus]
MSRAQGLGNEWRPGPAPSLKPARNPAAALAAICHSEIFPPLRSLCIAEPDVIGLANQWLLLSSLGSQWGEKGTHQKASPLISSSPGYLVRVPLCRGRRMFGVREAKIRIEMIQVELKTYFFVLFQMGIRKVSNLDSKFGGRSLRKPPPTVDPAVPTCV